ncbi:MAG: hypothetical protein C4294_09520 [Nitrospiraceae bacterium]
MPRAPVRMRPKTEQSKDEYVETRQRQGIKEVENGDQGDQNGADEIDPDHRPFLWKMIEVHPDGRAQK